MTAQVRCPLCTAPGHPQVLALAQTLRPVVMAALRGQHPTWQPQDGACPACVAAALARVQAQRRASSLHTTTEPPGTFPYYHPDEETVLGQPTRLPGHDGFDGAGVTVAFLDSGYYPHPDLTVDAHWPGMPEWHHRDVAQLRAQLAARPLRMVHYADLTDAGPVEGLDAASLWDGAGDSWHGQMTSVIALGNGLLSGGEWRGYAPGALALPIKIGRGGGRIPEADILAGLNWLLEDDRWARYGVRVLNVSVGGDFAEPWHVNPVCLAAEELSRRGVLIAAAAGNRGIESILAPANAPSVLTVGGVDDGNRRWSPLAADEVARLSLYSHNWLQIVNGHALLNKPEVLALARWLPSPVLPPTSMLAEMVAIGHLRDRLLAGGEGVEALAAHWRAALHDDPIYQRQHPGEDPDRWYAEMMAALRKRMNAHKWVHPYYQHVDGTSVAVAQVSAVAAQMIQANPDLMPSRVKTLLQDTALPLSHVDPARAGRGVVQPTAAVAAAQRSQGGALVGLPTSGTQPMHWPDAPHHGMGDRRVYVGLWAPDASAVSVVGDFNGWQPGLAALARTRGGWWHGVLWLPAGEHGYRLWVATPTGADWRPDPENPARRESGYAAETSVVRL